MLRIRLRRMGFRHDPSYRIVVTDSRNPRDGAFKEVIGHYDPVPDPPVVKIDTERASYWIARGAQPSEAVARFLKKPQAVPSAPAKDGEGG